MYFTELDVQRRNKDIAKNKEVKREKGKKKKGRRRGIVSSCRRVISLTHPLSFALLVETFLEISTDLASVLP